MSSSSAKHKRDLRIRRHARVRKTVRGTPERPRLAVFRSNKHTSAQVIDDRAGRTLAAASTLEIRGGGSTSNKDAAAEVGRLVAERAKASPSARVLQPGDVILEVSRKRVSNASEASAALRAVPAGRAVGLLINRGGDEQFVTVRKQ